MLKGFKDFLMRGNVVELAVAVIIGTAFTTIVTAVSDSFIKPLIAAIGGAKVTGLSWTIVGGNPESKIDFAVILTAIINFLIVAAVVYFLIVMPMKKLEERRRRGEEPAPSKPSDVDLLIEIRDLLQQQQGPQNGGTHGPGPQGLGPQGPGPQGPGPQGSGPQGPHGPQGYPPRPQQSPPPHRQY